MDLEEYARRTLRGGGSEEELEDLLAGRILAFKPRESQE